MFSLSNFLKPRSLGEWGENYVAGLYQRKGFKILGKNYFNRRGKRMGEIDLIALKDKQLVFIEVKTRASGAFGTGAESVNSFKQQKLLKACKLFVCQHPQFADFNQRIDVAEVMVELDRNHKTVNIIENAVEDNR